MSRLSLRLRLALGGAVAVIAALALAAFALSALFAAHSERLAAQELSVQLDHLIAGIDRDPETGGLRATAPPTDPRFALPFGGRYWQVDLPGADPHRSRSLWDETLPLPTDSLADGAEHVHRIAGPQGSTLLAVERMITLPLALGGDRLRVAVAMDAADLTAARGAFMRDLVPYLAALALVLIAAGWAQVFYGLRPLADLGRRVASVRAGDAARLGQDFPVEIRPLGEEIDALLAAREEELQRARNRAADLAHGLKTPLQALVGEAERLREAGQAPAAEVLEEITGTMQRHVTRELTRARLAAGTTRGRADLGKAVGQIARVLQRTPQGAALDWQASLPEGLWVAADPADLAEALGALMENAARHARRSVQVGARREGAHIRLTLEDDGPGIPPERIEALMARGARADEGGDGLGLTIASEIIAAIGGTLAFADAAPGLRLEIDFPAD